MRTVSRSVLAALLAVTAGGCVALGPSYQRPAAPVGERWDEAPAAAPSETAAADQLSPEWWRLFADPALDSLVERALAGNQDLALASARVAEARALAGRARADRFPQLGVSGEASKGEQLASFGVGDGQLDSERRGLSATLSYELDLFGRLRRLDEAARGELLASEAEARAVRLALVGDLARTWYQRTAAARELELLGSNLAARRSALDLQQQRLDAGVIAGVDFDRAEAELAATEAALPLAELALARAEHRLAVLLGTSPAAAELPPPPDRLVDPPSVPVGLPATLLARRPDLLAAEQRLIAATARIGVAKAELFPTLSLTGAYGYESVELGGFVSTSGSVWNVGAQLLGSIFSFGRGKARVEAAEARAEQAVASWRGAVLAALAEVEDALVERRVAVARGSALARRVAALERTHEAEQLRYSAGESAYLEVLDAERAQLSAASEAIAAERDALLATIDLVLALGGAWEPTATTEPAPTNQP